jgi:hypothetical protein
MPQAPLRRYPPSVAASVNSRFGVPAGQLDVRVEDEAITGMHPARFRFAPRRTLAGSPGTSSHIGEFDMIIMVQDLAAEALFVSYLQPSECPSRRAVEETVTEMILRHGSDGCAAEVAAEFGDHPEAAVRRMSWVRSELSGVLAAPRRPHFAS